MALVTRRFVYNTSIKVSAADLNLAKMGKKICTIRLGTLGVSKEFVNLVSGRNVLKVKIVSVETDKRFCDLGDEHVKREGYLSLEELHADLKTYYGTVEPTQPITIINFERALS
jgi:hypothetical protein